jgi:hypothetical protein
LDGQFPPSQQDDGGGEGERFGEFLGFAAFFPLFAMEGVHDVVWVSWFDGPGFKPLHDSLEAIDLGIGGQGALLLAIGVRLAEV